MNGNDERMKMADDDGADAAKMALDLVGRLADDLVVGTDAGDVSMLLRQARDVLSRVAAKTSETDIGVHIGSSSMTLFDVSDLLGYFEHNRLPTGIQRVQSELIFNILKSNDQATRLCCFVETRDRWVTVDTAKFMDICALSRMGGDPLEASWVAAIRELQSSIAAHTALEFPHGAMLVNIGTSWWLPNYFLYVRSAKIAASVRYVPLIYDLIPALMPENCDPELVQEFIGWLIGVLDHADFYVAISQATRRDLIAFAEKVGRPISEDRIAVVPLDADFRGAEKQSLPTGRRFSEDFVLFVSTLEARKNQLGALDAWAALIAKHGSDKVPRLVFVGKRGFKSDLILNRLENSADLRERVSILSGIEDVELQALYRDCLFTVYPSLYEGWGLPVTESLCYGKVPLIADNSSLPEAGGASALYVRTGSTSAMIAALERLILENGFRQDLENAILRDFRPRSWSAVAAGFAGQVREWAVTPVTQWHANMVHPDVYYPLRRNRSMRVWPGMGSAEAFRYGLGWYKMEDHGCWTRQFGGELEMRLSSSASCRLGFELFYLHRHDARYRLEVVGREDIFTEGRLDEEKVKWAFLDLPDMPFGTVIRIRLSTTVLYEPEAGRTGDPRRLGVGLRGFFVFGDEIASRINFIECVALGALCDLDFYRDRALDMKLG